MSESTHPNDEGHAHGVHGGDASCLRCGGIIRIQFVHDGKAYVHVGASQVSGTTALLHGDCDHEATIRLHEAVSRTRRTWDEGHVHWHTWLGHDEDDPDKEGWLRSVGEVSPPIHDLTDALNRLASIVPWDSGTAYTDPYARIFRCDRHPCTIHEEAS